MKKIKKYSFIGFVLLVFAAQIAYLFGFGFGTKEGTAHFADGAWPIVCRLLLGLAALAVALFVISHRKDSLPIPSSLFVFRAIGFVVALILWDGNMLVSLLFLAVVVCLILTVMETVRGKEGKTLAYLEIVPLLAFPILFFVFYRNLDLPVNSPVRILYLVTLLICTMDTLYSAMAKAKGKTAFSYGVFRLLAVLFTLTSGSSFILVLLCNSFDMGSYLILPIIFLGYGIDALGTFLLPAENLAALRPKTVGEADGETGDNLTEEISAESNGETVEISAKNEEETVENPADNQEE